MAYARLSAAPFWVSDSMTLNTFLELNNSAQFKTLSSFCIEAEYIATVCYQLHMKEFPLEALRWLKEYMNKDNAAALTTR